MGVICSRRAQNGWLGIAHGAQGVLYLTLALLPQFKNALIPVTLTVPTGRPGLNTTTYENEVLFQSNGVAIVATFFFITSLAHFWRMFVGKYIPEWDVLKKKTGKSCCSSMEVTGGDDSSDDDDNEKSSMFKDKPGTVQLTERELDAVKKVDAAIFVQRFWRWIEYALTSTLMILVISNVCGITDLYALGAIAISNLGMIFLGAQGDKAAGYWGKMSAFFYGSVVGLLAWVIIAAQVVILGVRAGGSAIPMVLSIFTVMFVLFWTFSLVELKFVNTYRTKDMFSAVLAREGCEDAYQFLSAGAKTTLGALVAAASLTLI